MVKQINKTSITTAILCRDNLAELVKTLDSVCNQPSNVNWPSVEILIVDGSTSTDISEYIKSFDTAHKLIHLCYINSNDIDVNGIYPSMNLALDMAHGQYIHFLNSGDTLLGSCL